MRVLTFHLELRFGKEEREPEGPAGAESMVIHQDQPRYIGFTPEPTASEQD